MLKAFVTGRTGFVGRVLVEHEELDVRDELEGCDVVIDLAAIASDKAADRAPERAVETNHRRAIQLAERARAAGVPRFVFASTCAVYGAAGTDEARDERAELRPATLYAKTKADADVELRAMATPSFSVTALRSATVYGLSPRMRFDVVVNMMTLYAFRDRKVMVFGGGRQWRPLVHVRDLARAFVLAARAPVEVVSGQAFNIGSDAQNHRIAEIASMVAAAMPEVAIEEVPAATPDTNSYRVSFAKARAALGFTPSRTVQDGIDEVARALEQGIIAPP